MTTENTKNSINTEDILAIFERYPEDELGIADILNLLDSKITLGNLNKIFSRLKRNNQITYAVSGKYRLSQNGNNSADKMATTPALKKRAVSKKYSLNQYQKNNIDKTANKSVLKTAKTKTINPPFRIGCFNDGSVIIESGKNELFLDKNQAKEMFEFLKPVFLSIKK